MVFSWLRDLTRRLAKPAPTSFRRAPRRPRLNLEALEDRTVPSSVSYNPTTEALTATISAGVQASVVVDPTSQNGLAVFASDVPTNGGLLFLASASDVKSVTVNLSGQDALTLGSNLGLPFYLQGGIQNYSVRINGTGTGNTLAIANAADDNAITPVFNTQVVTPPTTTAAGTLVFSNGPATPTLTIGVAANAVGLITDAYNLTATINTGTDTTNVRATSAGSSLTINGQASIDAVNIGSNAPNLFGTLANVHGTVNVSNPSGQTILTVDDSGDPVASGNVQITSGGITGLGTGGAAINYDQAGIGALNILGGSGRNFFTVQSTGKSRVTGEFTTTLEPGSGTGSQEVVVNGAAAGTNLVINAQAGSDTVILGFSNGSLAGLTGMTVAVEATSGGTVALNINDSSTGVGQTAYLETVGPATNPIHEFLIPSYAPANTAAVQVTFVPSQLDALSIHGSSGNNTYNISDFGAGLPTTINTGNGNDAVNITADSTSGYNLTLHGGTGSNSLTINDPSRTSTFNPNPAPQNTGTVTEHFLSPGISSTYTYTNMGSVGEKPDANHSFVQALYHDVYGRNGSQAELNSWVALLPTLGQAGVAAAFNHTPEAYAHVVNGWFQQFLQTAPSAKELAKYTSEFARGQTQEQVLSQILATRRFLQLAHAGAHEGAGAAYVEALYSQLLGVSANQIPPADLSHWLHELRRVGRQGVALEFLTGTPYRTLQIEADYQRLLHRAPTSQERANWFSSGLDLLSIQSGIESLPEFYTSGG